MKNVFYVALATMMMMMVVSCETEESNLGIDTTQTLDLASDEYQDSNVGIYNGVFTTNDGQQRGSIEVRIPADELTLPSATLKLSNGTNITLEASQVVFKDVVVTNLIFNADVAASFVFSVSPSGKNPVIQNVILNDTEGAILIRKHTTRAPVVPIPGTYVCTDCGTHPTLNNSIPQTFNLLMFTTPSGDSTFDTEVTLGMNVFTGTGAQDTCIVIGTETSCDISGSFAVSGAPIDWSGTHTFNNEATGANDCSDASGTWTFDSNNFGMLSGTFVSDNACPTELIFEDFEDSTLTYTTSVPEFSDGEEDYFTRTDFSNIFSAPSGVNIDGVQGTFFFGAQDINGEGANELQFINFDDIDITGLSQITFTALFAEDDDGTDQDWDDFDSSSFDFVNVEYSFDNGGTWTPFFAINADPDTTTLTGSNGLPRVDTNLDGFGDGAEITDTLTEYSSSFMTMGATAVDIRIAISFDSGDEDIAIDNVSISGI